MGPVSLRVAGNQQKVFSRGLPTVSHRTFWECGLQTQTRVGAASL